MARSWEAALPVFFVQALLQSVWVTFRSKEVINPVFPGRDVSFPPQGDGHDARGAELHVLERSASLPLSLLWSGIATPCLTLDRRSSPGAAARNASRPRNGEGV